MSPIMAEMQQPDLSRAPGAGRPGRAGAGWGRRLLMPLIVLAVAGAIMLYSRRQEAQHTVEVEHALQAMLEEVAGRRAASTPPRTEQMEASPGLVAHLESIMGD